MEESLVLCIGVELVDPGKKCGNVHTAAGIH
jgi:hypothetical protein